MPECSGASLAKRPHLDSRIENCPGGKKSAGGSVSVSSADARKKGAMGVGTPDVSLSTAFSSSSSLVLQIDMLSHFWINREALLPTGLCLIWFRVTMFSLGHVLTFSVISGSSV